MVEKASPALLGGSMYAAEWKDIRLILNFADLPAASGAHMVSISGQFYTGVMMDIDYVPDFEEDVERCFLQLWKRLPQLEVGIYVEDSPESILTGMSVDNPYDIYYYSKAGSKEHVVYAIQMMEYENNREDLGSPFVEMEEEEIAT